jgi:hypothetical protein
MSGCASVGSTSGMDISVFASSISLFSVQLLQLAAFLVFMKRRQVKISTEYILVMSGLAIHLVIKIITFALWYAGPEVDGGVVSGVLNRFAWVSGCLVLILLLIAWMEAAHTQFAHGTERFLFWLKFGAIVVSVGDFLGVMVPMAVFLAQRGTSASASSYQASIYFHVVFQVFLAVLFLVYGIILVILLNRSRRGDNLQKVYVILIGVAILIVYACPAALFLVRPLGGCVPSGLFWAFVYIVPTGLLSLVIFFLLVLYIEKRRADSIRNELVTDVLLKFATPPAYDSNNF